MITSCVFSCVLLGYFKLGHKKINNKFNISLQRALLFGALYWYM